jgi:rhodanese-related sulfurtransferase
MNATEAFQLLEKKDAILIDVREEMELQESGFASGAIWMPTSKIGENHPDWDQLKRSLPKNKQIILYCKSGARSGRIAELLAQEGFQTVNLGGFSVWKAAQLPVSSFPKKT